MSAHPGFAPSIDAASSSRESIPRPPAPGAALEVVERGVVVRRAPLDAVPFRIGRSPDNALAIADASVSRHHAEVTFEQGAFAIRDLGSSNGLFVDGARVSESALADGCTILLGELALRFRWQPQALANEARLALLDRCVVLAGFDREAKAALAARIGQRSFPRGAWVRRQGASIGGLLIVAEGRLDRVEINEEGGERTLGSLGPGQWTGDGVLAGTAPRHALRAASDATLLEVPQELLNELMTRQPDLRHSMILGAHQLLGGPLPSAGPAAGAAVLVAAATPRSAPPTPPAPTTPAASTATGARVEAVIVGEDKKLAAARKRVEEASRSGKGVLLCGETGTGRHLLARHYHGSGTTREESYVEVNLAELPDNGANAAIFGAEAGAASAPGRSVLGALEMAGRGTLAISHAERLDPYAQAVLANYLRLGWFHRVEGQSAVRAEARVVLIADGNEAEVVAHLAPPLREMLGAPAVLPPLAQRVKDVAALAEHFLAAATRRSRKQLGGLARETLERLVSYAWPGNVAELENVVERMAILAPEGVELTTDLLFVVPPEKEKHRLNVLHNEGVRAALGHPRLFAVVTAVNLVFVGLVLVWTLLGARSPAGQPLADPTTNPGMLATWLVWFPILPLSAFLIGRVWCGICPIAGFGELVARLHRFSRPIPKLFKRLDVWMLVAAYVTVEYVEGVIEVDSRPGASAGFLLVILALAAFFTVVWERHAFCRYLCPLAGWLGAYATLSPFEVRANKRICQTQCGQLTCFKGTAHSPGCPVFLYPASVTSNAECLMCGSCLHNCENRGVQVNLRPPLAELWQNSQPVRALSTLALVILAIMLMHGLNQVPWWRPIKAAIPFGPEMKRLTIFSGLILAVLGAFTTAAALSAAASREKLGANFARYGIAFIPLALALHLNVITRKLLGEGMPTILGYLGKLRGALFGSVPMTAGVAIDGPFAPPVLVRFINALGVLTGIVAALVAILMIARRASREAVFARALPHLLLLALLGGLALTTATAVKAPKAPPAAAAPVEAPADSRVVEPTATPAATGSRPPAPVPETGSRAQAKSPTKVAVPQLAAHNGLTCSRSEVIPRAQRTSRVERVSRPGTG